MTATPDATGPWRISTHPAGLDDDALFARCTMLRGRSSGPGGQHRNRVATHIELRYEPGGITVQAGERRSPEVNRKVALHRLRFALAVGVRTPVPPGEARTALWAQRCSRDGKIRCSGKHHDYPALIAEALDVLAACKWDVARASIRLACTRSQLIKLLAGHPPALAVLNEHRRARGDRPLKRP